MQQAGLRSKGSAKASSPCEQCAVGTAAKATGRVPGDGGGKDAMGTIAGEPVSNELDDERRLQEIFWRLYGVGLCNTDIRGHRIADLSQELLVGTLVVGEPAGRLDDTRAQQRIDDLDIAEFEIGQRREKDGHAVLLIQAVTPRFERFVRPLQGPIRKSLWCQAQGADFGQAFEVRPKAQAASKADICCRRDRFRSEHLVAANDAPNTAVDDVFPQGKSIGIPRQAVDATFSRSEKSIE